MTDEPYSEGAVLINQTLWRLSTKRGCVDYNI